MGPQFTTMYFTSKHGRMNLRREALWWRAEAARFSQTLSCQKGNGWISMRNWAKALEFTTWSGSLEKRKSRLPIRDSCKCNEGAGCRSNLSPTSYKFVFPLTTLSIGGSYLTQNDCLLLHYNPCEPSEHTRQMLFPPSLPEEDKFIGDESAGLKGLLN